MWDGVRKWDNSSWTDRLGMITDNEGSDVVPVFTIPLKLSLNEMGWDVFSEDRLSTLRKSQHDSQWFCWLHQQTSNRTLSVTLPHFCWKRFKFNMSQVPIIHSRLTERCEPLRADVNKLHCSSYTHHKLQSHTRKKQEKKILWSWTPGAGFTEHS